jgi:hypothetical protein
MGTPAPTAQGEDAKRSYVPMRCRGCKGHAYMGMSDAARAAVECAIKCVPRLRVPDAVLAVDVL